MSWTNKFKLNTEELNEILNISLDLKRSPVGVRFLFTKEDYENSNSDSRTGTIVYCTAIRNAMNGESLKLKEENFACIASAMALGIADISEEFTSGCRNCDKKVYEDLTVSRQIAKNMVFCKHKAYGVEIKPLSKFTKHNPNVVILVTYPYNLMRIVQGYAYKFGHLKNLHLGGMNAICQELTSFVHEENTLNISSLCSGTRAVSQWDDSELGIGIPFNKLQEISFGILDTINVMDNNNHKKIIQNKLLNSEILEDFNVELNSNYYRGAYRAPKDL